MMAQLVSRAVARARVGEDADLAQRVRERGEALASVLAGLLKLSRVHAADSLFRLAIPVGPDHVADNDLFPGTTGQHEHGSPSWMVPNSSVRLCTTTPFQKTVK